MEMEMAVRSMLLSEIQSVLSIARRRYGYTLVHQSSRPAQDDQSAIFHSFALLRARLLRCEDLSELHPSNVLRPFLDLIRHEHTSSTLTGAALEAVQHFMQTWDWRAGPPQASVSDVLSDIVDAVSQCRFQETSTESDQNVLVLVVHVLQAVILSPCASKLSDHSMWQLVESLYALSRANRNDPHITLSLRSTATNFLHQVIEFIFQSPSVYVDPMLRSVHASTTEDAGFGLPCAVKIVGFLCQKLQPRGSGFGSGSTLSATSSASGSLSTRREVLLSFSLLQRALVACDAQQMANVASLMLFIKDDLSGAILRYCRLGASTDMKIPVLCLGIIRLLWTKLRPMLKMQLEALFNGVFCHTLHWTIAHLDLSNPIFPDSGDVTASQKAEKASNFSNVEAVREEFTGEIVPLNKLFAVSFEILDCLIDMLAEPSILPDLYVNFDCDGNRSDLTHTMFELLSQVVVKSHHACQETSDEVHFLWAQAMGELTLRGQFNSLYAVYTRTQHKPTNALSAASADGESRGSRSGPQESITADALHRKRQRKKYFQHGIQEFNRKPLAGIKYLQQNTFLPTPVNARSLAVFLRSLPPGLSKASVGMYLGAVGKEVKDFEKSDIHEADTIEFHRDVLSNFVHSFNFEGESIVSALRMFLASFRLPGEAQQIDRILNVFSMQVYEQCRERFLMASADVAYLLSFSLIMLNTDLHNSNIRPEKKMKLDDFIKNNRNYGDEVSKKQDLPDDFLTELYEALAKEEIKTCEDDSKHGEVTSDRWKDLLYQAESDPQNSRLIVHQSPCSGQQPRSPRAVAKLDSPRRHTQPSPQPRRTKKKLRRRKSTPAKSRQNGADEPRQSTEEDSDELFDPSGDLFRYDNNTGYQYDCHIFELVHQQWIRAFSSVFQRFVDVSNVSTKGSADGSHAADARRSVETGYLPEKGMLQLACNGFVLCAAVASHHGLLDEFNQLFVTICKFTSLYPSDVYPLGNNGRDNGLVAFCNNQSAPVACAAMLKLVGTCAKSIHSDSWKHFFHVISTLREFRALPDRLLYASLGSSDSLLTADERCEIIDLVRFNKEDLERRETQSAKEASNVNGSSGFFSGVAWLMSALDTSISGSQSPATTPSHGAKGSSATSLRADSDFSLWTPVEMAAKAEDLIVRSEKARQAPPAMGHANPAFATTEWVRQTLQPYRLELLLDDLASLPVHSLTEVMKSLHEEIVDALSGSPKSAKRQSTDPSRRRQSAFSLSTPPLPVDEETLSQPHLRRLSPGGCVLFEHLIARIITALPRETFAGHVDSFYDVLETHYLKVLDLVRPILVKNMVINGIGYECASYTVEKALEGLITLVLKSRSDQALGLLMDFLTTLADMSSDEELIRPYLSIILSGFKRIADAYNLRTVSFDRGEWVTVANLIGWAADQPHASAHAFTLLEKLVASEVWLAEVETTFSLMDVYTKALMFALLHGSAQSQAKWPRTRPLELLSILFDRLQESDAEIDEEERLRQLGGMTLICRHSLRPQVSVVSDEPSGQTPANESILSSLECLRQMVHSNRCRDSFTGGAWLELLSSGLLVIGSEIIHRKPRFLETRRRQGSDDGGLSGPFLFYQRNVPPSVTLSAVLVEKSDKQEGAKSKQNTRRRRPSVVKDPSALRPHVMIVEMISWVVCEKLDQLLLLPRFANVWDELIDVLLAFIEFTHMGRRGSGNSEEMLMALERRCVLSAHEEIIEHAKSIIRRLTLLQNSHAAAQGGGEDDKGTLSGARFHALMHVLVEKCQSKGAEYYDQLFPSKEDSSSGELTPPLAEDDSLDGNDESDVGALNRTARSDSKEDGNLPRGDLKEPTQHPSSDVNHSVENH